MQMMDPECVRERWLELQDPSAFDALHAACRTAAVHERAVGFSWWAYHPRPFARELAGENPLGGGGRDARLGLDASGRVVFQYLRDDLFLLYAWEAEEYCDVVQFHGQVSKLERLVFADGRLAEEIEVGGGTRYDGVLAVQVTRWSYEQGRLASGFKTYESQGHRSWGSSERGSYWKAQAYGFEYDADGRLLRIEWSHGRSEIADGGDVEAAQVAARAGFPEDYELGHLYDGRTQQREVELPSPEQAFEGLAEPLGDAVFAAIERSRGALGPLEFVLVAAAGTRTRVVAAGAAFVERARKMTQDVRELLLVTYEMPAGTAGVDVIDVVADDVLRGLRAGEQALAHERRSPRQAEFQRELIATLHGRPWTDVAPTFVVLGLPTHDSEDGWTSRQRKSRTPLTELGERCGKARADAFLARAGGTGARPTNEERPSSREALIDLLLSSGLTKDEARPVAADAQWGIVLEPGGKGTSRLGGAPVLASDTPWPHAEDRPLTHLATIALDELPAIEGRELLPERGLLSFFVDTSEEGEFVEPIEPEDDDDRRALAAVIHTPPGVPTHEPTPPGEALRQRRVTPTARLQLRSVGFGAARQRYGIDALAETALEHLTYRVNGTVPHQLLGHPPAVQEDPREEDQIVLFHIGDDPALHFSFIDAGDIHFLGTATDIRHSHWDRLTVWPDSC